jgi:LmbE family N-acetylglucosaminyl deacetylase
VTVFVATGKRRKESIAALGSLGIAESRQHYAAMPDGRLAQRASQLGLVIATTADAYGVDSIVSFGRDGFDNHADHIATYAAAQSAAAETGLEHFVRASGPESDISFQGSPSVKLGAMALHRSQYPLEDPDFWRGFGPYQAQFGLEHYRAA